MPNHARVLQGRFFPAKLETEGDDAIFNTLLSVTNPTNFGARLKASVIAGQLEFIELSEKKSNNHQTYEIFRSTLRTQ